MKIHEYQAKELFSKYGIPIPKGRVVEREEELDEALKITGLPAVLKAQVHAGGRGKAGGIRVVNSKDEALEFLKNFLGKNLITYQTGPEGVRVSKVLVEEKADIDKELYLSIIIDPSQGIPVIMASEAGGMEIEEIARDFPEKIKKVYVDPFIGIKPFHARKLASELGIRDKVRDFQNIVIPLFKLFIQNDLSLAEINPLAITREGRILPIDAKINVDDNSLFRHEDLQELRDVSQEDPYEVEAKEKGLANYVKLDGNIGIIVNGAGLAMAVMDIIKLYGGSPANFLDIGTVNNPERVVNAFKILLKDKNVKSILVNVFGGIARVDIIAQGIVEAYRNLDIKVPVVVRLAGTNVEEADRIIKEAGIPVERAYRMDEAARKACEGVR